MDNLTLSLVVLIFFLGLFLYFATLGFPPDEGERRIPTKRCAVSRLFTLKALGV